MIFCQFTHYFNFDTFIITLQMDVENALFTGRHINAIASKFSSSFWKIIFKVGLAQFDSR